MARNRLLAVAAGVGVVAGALLPSDYALGLSNLESSPHPSYRTVIAVFYLAASGAFAVAFGFALAGFLRVPRERRTRTLAVAGAFFVAYGGATLVGDLIGLSEDFSRNPTWLYTAAECAAAAADLSLVVAAALVARGVLSTAANPVLGWACLVLGARFALAAAGYGFALAGLYHFVSPDGRFTGGMVSIAVGQSLAATAAVTAAIAFNGGSRRERGLGVAAAVFSLGFLTIAVGWTLFATLDSGATNWLAASSDLALAVAAAVGAAAFFRR